MVTSIGCRDDTQITVVQMDGKGHFGSNMELRFTRYEHAPNQLWCQRSRGRPFGEKHGPLPVDRTEKMAAAKNPTWSPKTQERKWFSTNHLMGRGYWVWPYR